MLTLTNGNQVLTSFLHETRSQFGNAEFEILSAGELAFDHAEIIASSLSTLRRSADNFYILFDFLPEKFTLASMQKIQEIILNISILPANFRRKIASLVEETDEYSDGKGTAPQSCSERKRHNADNPCSLQKRERFLRIVYQICNKFTSLSFKVIDELIYML